MAISMVRKPSETPNITNIDDIVPFRYAYGNQNGYVIGRGNEISNTVNGNQITINSGRLVLNGVESDVDANGITYTVDAVSETRYFVAYYEVNLYNNSADIKFTFNTATYPEIDLGDDLTENSTGIARLVLYKFVATNGVIANVQKVVSAIKYTAEVKVKNSIRSDVATKAETADSIDWTNPTNAVSNKVVNANSLTSFLSAGKITNSGYNIFEPNNMTKNIGNTGNSYVIVTPVISQEVTRNIGALGIYKSPSGTIVCRDNINIIGFWYIIIG